MVTTEVKAAVMSTVWMSDTTSSGDAFSTPGARPSISLYTLRCSMSMSTVSSSSESEASSDAENTICEEHTTRTRQGEGGECVCGGCYTRLRIHISPEACSRTLSAWGTAARSGDEGEGRGCRG
jgi:hypothetical protein